MCPLCVVAVGAGLGLSRWFGVDDIISSLWIGALLASLSWWTVVWLRKKNWNLKCDKFILPLAYYTLTILPLYYYDIVGHPLNTVFGIDKIIFGIVLGTAVFSASVWFHNFLKIKNQGKQFFVYQKVVLPLAFLTLTSLIFYAIMKWRII